MKKPHARLKISKTPTNASKIFLEKDGLGKFAYSLFLYVLFLLRTFNLSKKQKANETNAPMESVLSNKDLCASSSCKTVIAIMQE